MMSLDHAHNDYVEFLVEGGPLGMLLLGLLYFYALLRCVLARIRSERSSARGLALGALVAIAIHQTVEFPLQIPAVALALVAMIGVASLTDTSSRRGG